VVTVTVASQTNVTCNGGNDGSITVNPASGGSGSGYTYSDGGAYQSSTTFSGLTAGSYTITAKDSNGCLSAGVPVTITQPTALNLGLAETDVTIYGGSNGTVRVPRTANTTNITFEQVEGEAMVIALDLKGVAVSGGSACHSGSTEPSHVLMAMGLDKNAARASLRFSLMKTATDADVDHVLRVVPEALEHLRALSPVAAGTLG